MEIEKNIKLGVIVGSLRKGSYSRKIAKALMRRAPSPWQSAIIEIGNLSMYNQDLDAKPPKVWERFRQDVAACDALLFVTPEYNRSVPGVLKNATDIGSRPEENNVFAGKPAAVVSVSPYATGGMAANHALRQSFVYLDLAVMQQPEAYIQDADAFVDGAGKGAKVTNDALTTFMAAFAQWGRRVGTSSTVQSFDEFMGEREAASNAYISGNPKLLTEISTTRNPAAFFPPSGDTIVGAKAVNRANEKAAQAFQKGSRGHFKILASDSGNDFAWWTGIQYSEVRMKGKKGPVQMELRVTEIFRNENGAWKLVQRHADIIDPKKE